MKDIFIAIKCKHENIDMRKFKNDILCLLKSKNLHSEIKIISEIRPESFPNIYKDMTSFSSRIQAILNWVSNNYCRTISLKEAANLISLSSYHFEKIFLSEIGMSFKKYLNAFRLYKAAELLRSNCTISITDACLDVGFYDLSNFIGQFKRVFGCSPKKYMNCHLNPEKCLLRKRSIFYLNHINKLDCALNFSLKLACYIKKTIK